MTEPTYRMCGYCGTLPLEVVLQRSDDAPNDAGGQVASAGNTEHAPDCPLYQPPEMSVPIPAEGPVWLPWGWQFNRGP